MRFVAVCGIALLLAGCGGTDSGVPIPAELGRVKGRVTLDGRPLAGALILFVPPQDVDPWRESKAVTDENGLYDLVYFDETFGASPAVHQVSITCPDPQNVEKQIIPARYNIESTLERTVVAGENTFDFDLTSP